MWELGKCSCEENENSTCAALDAAVCEIGEDLVETVGVG